MKIEQRLPNVRRNRMARMWQTLPLIPLLLLAAACGRDPGDRGAGAHDTSGTVRLLHDAIGETIRFEHPARRVVSLAPNITEIIYAIGAGKLLVGRSTYCNYPPETAGVPMVADLQTLNYEKISSLAPDLLLMTYVGNARASYMKLRDLGLRPFVLRDSSIDQVVSAIDTVGVMLGHEREAHVVSDGLRRTIDSVKALTKDTVTAFIVINTIPLMTVSSGFIDHVLTIAGGKNIAGGGTVAYPKYSREELVRQDPEVIIVPGRSWSLVDELLTAYPEWRRLRAVRNGHVYVIPEDILLRPGPRIGIGLVKLYQALHGADAHAVFGGGVEGR